MSGSSRRPRPRAATRRSHGPARDRPCQRNRLARDIADVPREQAISHCGACRTRRAIVHDLRTGEASRWLPATYGEPVEFALSADRERDRGRRPELGGLRLGHVVRDEARRRARARRPGGPGRRHLREPESDGRTLAVGRSSEGTVRIWDVDAQRFIGEPIRVTKRAAYPPVIAPVFSPDGRTIRAHRRDVERDPLRGPGDGSGDPAFHRSTSGGLPESHGAPDGGRIRGRRLRVDARPHQRVGHRIREATGIGERARAPCVRRGFLARRAHLRHEQQRHDLVGRLDVLADRSSYGCLGRGVRLRLQRCVQPGREDAGRGLRLRQPRSVGRQPRVMGATAARSPVGTSPEPSGTSTSRIACISARARSGLPAGDARRR